MSFYIEGHYESLSAQRRQALAASIDALYTAFSVHRMPPPSRTSMSSVSEANEAILYGRSPRTLTSEELSSPASSLFYTWGGKAELRCLLPRMLELIATEPHSLDAEVVFKKIHLADFATWPDHERSAVLTFVDALWNFVLSEFPCPLFRAERALCAIGCGFGDLSPRLNTWLKLASAPATCHLAECVLECLERIHLRHKELPNAFWDNAPESAASLKRFLHSPALKHELERRFFLFETAAPEIGQALSWSHKLLENVSS